VALTTRPPATPGPPSTTTTTAVTAEQAASISVTTKLNEKAIEDRRRKQENKQTVNQKKCQICFFCVLRKKVLPCIDCDVTSLRRLLAEKNCGCRPCSHPQQRKKLFSRKKILAGRFISLRHVLLSNFMPKQEALPLGSFYIFPGVSYTLEFLLH
jgi:hypothetical protein